MMASALARVRDAWRSFTLGPFDLKDRNASRVLGYGQPSSSGIAVNQDTALTFSAVFNAIWLISNAVASLPLPLYKRVANGKEKFVDHPLYRLMHDEPNDDMTSIVFRRTLQAHALSWGNGYAEIERDGAGRPLALHVLTPDRVTPYRENNTGPVRYLVRNASGLDVELEADDVLHIPGLGFDGICGYSVIRYARESIGLGLAAQRFGATFFGNHSVAGGVLQHPGQLNKEAHERLKDSMRAYSRDRAHDTLILEEGMTWTQTTIPPDDSQFLQTRKFEVTEIARWFNLPPHKLKDLERATFTNIEHQSIEYLTDTLMPWLVVWEQECNRKLIRPLERRTQFFLHTVNAILRGDIKTRYDAYAVGRQWGWESPNSVLELEDRNTIGEQGDVFLIPANMVTAETPPRWVEPSRTPSAQEPQPSPQQRDLAMLLQLQLEKLRERPHIDVLPPSAAEIADLVSRQISLALEELRLSHPEPAPVSVPAPEEKPARQTIPPGVITAQRAAVVDVVGRMVRRETGRIRRTKTAEKLGSWMQDFYPRHSEAFAAALVPVVQTHLGFIGSDRDPVAMAHELVAHQIEQARGQIHAILDGNPEGLEDAMAPLLLRWETERPAAIADALMTEEIQHVHAT